MNESNEDDICHLYPPLLFKLCVSFSFYRIKRSFLTCSVDKSYVPAFILFLIVVMVSIADLLFHTQRLRLPCIKLHCAPCSLFRFLSFLFTFAIIQDMTESPFKLRHPTDYHLQQQQHQYYHHQQQQQQQQVLMEDYPQQGGFLSPLLSDFDELDVKHNNRVIDMDIMSEESPSDYSSVLSNSHPPQSFLMDFHQKYNSADTLLSVSPQSPTLFNGPFSAPSQMGYLAALNQNTSMEDFESLQLQ